MSTPQIYTKKIKKLNLSNKNMPLSGTIDYGNIGVDGVELPPNIFASPLPLLPIDSFYRRLDGVYTRSPLPVSSTSEKIVNVNNTTQTTTTLTTTKNVVTVPPDNDVTVTKTKSITTTKTPTGTISTDNYGNSIVQANDGQVFFGHTTTTTTTSTTTSITTLAGGRISILITSSTTPSTTPAGVVFTSPDTVSTTSVTAVGSTSRGRDGTTTSLVVTTSGKTFHLTTSIPIPGTSSTIKDENGNPVGTFTPNGNGITTIEITLPPTGVSSSSTTSQIIVFTVPDTTYRSTTPTTTTVPALTTNATNSSVGFADLNGHNTSNQDTSTSTSTSNAQLQPFLALNTNNPDHPGGFISWFKDNAILLTLALGTIGAIAGCVVIYRCRWDARNRAEDLSRQARDRAEDLSRHARDRAEDLSRHARDRAEDLLRQAKLSATTINGQADAAFVQIENGIKFDPPVTPRDLIQTTTVIEQQRDLLIRQAKQQSLAYQDQFRQPFDDVVTKIADKANELVNTATIAQRESLRVPAERIGHPRTGERRLQYASDIPEQDLQKIDALALALDNLTKLSAHSSLKIFLIETIWNQIDKALSDPALATNSRKYIVDTLLPIYTQEADSVVIWQLENNSATDLWNANLNYSPTTYQIKEIWEIDYAKSITSLKTPYKTNFFELDKPIFKGSGSSTRMIHLDDKNTQYLGSEAKDIVVVGGKGGAKYDIATGAGDDIVYISNEVFKDKDSTVNILGGTGANTYVIQVKDGWSSLLGSIHIWDFDSSKDKIILDSAESFQNPNINLSKVIHYSSPFISSPAKENGQIELTSAIPSLWDRFISLSHSDNVYKAVSYTYWGIGVPNIILDQTSTNKPTKQEVRRLTDANVFKSNYLGDVLDSINTNAYLSTETKPQTIYSQFDSINDHDFYRVSLHKGGSYTFSLERPFTPAPPVYRENYDGNIILIDLIEPPNPTSLVLRNKDGFVLNDASSGIIRSATEGGSCRIDFVSPYDGDFYLDASGYLKGNGNGINHDNDYTITTVAIPREQPSYHNDSTTIGITDENCGYASYSLDLKAGDFYKYQLIGDTSSVFLPHISIKDPNTFNVLDARVFKDNTNQYITGFSFLATQTGKYLIDIVDPNFKGRIFYSGHASDIPGDLQTAVFLPKDTAINSKIDFAGDHDVFKMHITQGNYIDWYADGELTLLTQLRDKQGNVLRESNCDNGLSNSYFISKTDDYYIDVSSFSEQQLGKYCFQYSVMNSAI